LAGDVANLDGTGSIFDVPQIDEVLQERCRTLDIHPTGPLYGKGELRTQGEVRSLESECIERFASFARGLADNDLEQERRALRLRVQNLEWRFQDEGLRLQFRLHRGAFATAVLRELLSGGDGLEESGE
jgi:tRNA pseudouridine13 synthase